MADASKAGAGVRQQIINVLLDRAGTYEYEATQQADEILALIKGNEPPGGWFHFGSHVDWDGELEFSSATGEDGLPLWERPLPMRSEVLVEDWTPSGSGWRELEEGESAGGREFITHGWLARSIDSFHKIRSWVQDEDRPTRWSKQMDSLQEDREIAAVVRERGDSEVEPMDELAAHFGINLKTDEVQ